MTTIEQAAYGANTSAELNSVRNTSLSQRSDKSFEAMVSKKTLPLAEPENTKIATTMTVSDALEYAASGNITASVNAIALTLQGSSSSAQDVNQDGAINILDIVKNTAQQNIESKNTDVTDAVSYINAGKSAEALNAMVMALNGTPVGQQDANNDGLINILDIIQNLNS